MRVLFICKHNRFRSKVAEVLFRYYNKNKNNVARSRGIIKDILAAQSVVGVMKQRGIPLKDRISRKVSNGDIRWADLIIVVADNADRKFNKKTIVWKISDVNQKDVEGIERRVDIVEKRIKNLISMLK